MLKAIAQDPALRVAHLAQEQALPVAHPAMEHDWQQLSFIHWAYPPAAVRRCLPAGVELDTFNDTAWIGLIPFRLRVRVPSGPALAWFGVFPETNVRTYVRGPDGGRGILFLSLDAPRRIAVWLARHTYHLPFDVAAMKMSTSNEVRHYASRRISGRHRGASSAATVHVGTPIDAADITQLERFLTDRWRLYAAVRGGIGVVRVEHPPWRLHRARVSDVDAGLLVAAGLPYPNGPPQVLAARDVRARLTRLRACHHDEQRVAA
jgi:uncharacterized protein YqjF (DUF2071 family)